MTLKNLSIGVCALLLTPAVASAAPVVFTDRDQFVAATQPQTSVDFDAVTPVSFAGSSTTTGSMTFSGGFSVNAPQGHFVTSFIGSHFQNGYTINDTHAVYGVSSRNQSMRIDFLNPILSWGADFLDLGDQGKLTFLRFNDENDQTVGEIQVSGFGEWEQAFFGIDFDGQAASSLEFLSIITPQQEDAFIIDNVAYSIDRNGTPGPSPVPLPASALLFGTGGAMLMTLRRRNGTRKARH